MSQNIPFLFGAGGGQPVPTQASQQPQNAPGAPQQQQPNGQAAAAMPGLHAAFQQNAQIPAMPAMPANIAELLKGIPPEQLMGIVQLVQSGMLQPPPAPAPAQQPAFTPVAEPTAPRVHAEASAPVVRQEDVDMDKEDGELEEGEELEAGRDRDFLRPPPTGPRKRSVTPRDRYGRAQDRRASLQDQSSSPRPAHARKASTQNNALLDGGHGSPPSSIAKKVSVNGMSNGHRKVDSGSAARAFVLQMHKAGYSFDQLAREIPNTKALRRMYKALGLPVPAEKSVAQINGTVAPSPQPMQLDSVSVHTPQQPAATEDRKVSVIKRPLPAKPAAAVDRAEYLAKLAAARTSKGRPAAAVAAPTTPASTQPVEQASIVPSTTAQTVPEPATPAAATQPSNPPSAVRAAVKTELVRQKLEKLKAEQAAKASAAQQSSDPPVAPSPFAKPALGRQQPATISALSGGLGAGLTDVGNQVSQAFQQAFAAPAPAPPPIQPIYAPPAPLQTAFSPTPPTPGRPFSALPGLFMASTPTQPSPYAQPPPAVSSPATASRPNPPMFADQQTASVVTSKSFAASPAASPAPINVVRKRSVAADFDTDLPASAAPNPPKRPLFGQSRSNSESERFIIEVNDDEEEEDDEDEGDGDAMDTEETPAHSNGMRKPDTLPGFPSKPSFASGMSTPPVITPGSLEHNKAIADLKRKIAIRELAQREREAKAKAKTNGKQDASATTSGKSTPLTSAAAPLAVDTTIPVEDTKEGPSQVGAQINSASTNGSSSATTIARQQEKAQLEERLKELHGHFAQGDGTATKPPPQAQAALEPAIPAMTANGGEAADRVGAAGNTEASKSAVSAVQEPVETSSVEEGELSDGAAQPSKAPTDGHLSVPEDDGKVGSQATTASGTSQPDTDDALVAGAPAQPQAQADEAPDATGETIQDVAADEEMDIDEESSENDDVDDDDDEDTDDLDGPVPQGMAMHSVTATNSGEVSDSDDDSSSASSTSTGDREPAAVGTPKAELSDVAMEDEDEDDYEPEPIADTFASNESASMGAAPTAISDVQKVERAITDVDKPGIVDDLAPELQPQKSQQTVIEDEETNSRTSYYRPYESVLTQFKDFRYHPDYLDKVSGGYRSLTYSHAIDPTTQLCMYEAAGGQCNDKACRDQHFKTMALSDTDLLKMLGTHRIPADTAEDKQKWNTGLGAVVKHLRSTNQGKDANAIATRIAAYRREFVGDPTKTLNLT